MKQESLKWEIAARPDKWGTATLITLGKGHAHRWDLLTSSKKFKGLIDKDWTREDQNLEPTEEMVLFDDAETVLRLNEKNFNKTIAAHSCLVVAARYPWCSECKSTAWDSVSEACPDGPDVSIPRGIKMVLCVACLLHVGR